MDLDVASDESEDERDPFLPSLKTLTGVGHPCSIPWSNEVRTLMAGLESDRLWNTEGPWVPSSPFDLSLARLEIALSDTVSRVYSYKDRLSTETGDRNEHLSAQLGVGVGPSCLRATVTGKYDKTVMTKKSVSKLFTMLT